MSIDQHDDISSVDDREEAKHKLDQLDSKLSPSHQRILAVMRDDSTLSNVQVALKANTTDRNVRYFIESASQKKI